MIANLSRICVVIVPLLFAASASRAEQSTNPLTLDVAATQPLHPLLDPSRWRLETLGTGMADVTNRHVAMGGARVAFDYYTDTNFCLRCELTSYGVSTHDGDAAAGQGSLGLRHHFYQFGNSSIFNDVGFGVFYAGRRVPESGTYLNLTFHCGLGIDHPISDTVDLIVGVRYFHLSNARLEGPKHNPSLNGPEAYIGLMFRL